MDYSVEPEPESQADDDAENMMKVRSCCAWPMPAGGSGW